MKICILDAVPEVYWAADEGRNDGGKFATMLAAENTGAELTVLCITRGEWPVSVDDYDAYLLSGSPCSANAHYDWTDSLERLIATIIDRAIPLVGVCFGHQFIARHLGGTVVRSAHGWRVGLHPSTVIAHQAWMQPERTENCIYYFNEDEISELPEGATHIASAPGCHFASWSLNGRIFCVQGHPEQPLVSMRNFIAANRGSIDDGVLDRAEASMRGRSTDADAWSHWIAHFLTSTG